MMKASGTARWHPIQQRRAAPDALGRVALLAQAAHEEGAHLDVVLEDEDVRCAHAPRALATYLFSFARSEVSLGPLTVRSATCPMPLT